MAHPQGRRPEPLIPLFSTEGANSMRTNPTRSWSRRLAAAVLAITAMVAATGVSACSSSAPADSSASPATGQHVAASDFATAMKAPGTIVLDVRTPAEYASGHLP